MKQLRDDCPDSVTEVSKKIHITCHALQGLPALYASPVFGMFEARLNDSEPPSAAACQALMRLVTVMSRSYINTEVDKSRGSETQYMEVVRRELLQFLQNNVQNRDLVRTLEPSSLSEVCWFTALHPNHCRNVLLADCRCRLLYLWKMVCVALHVLVSFACCHLLFVCNA